MSLTSGLVDRQIQFCNYLRAGFTGNLNLPGWALVGAIAGTANATQENLVNPVTTGPKDHGSDGTMQWRGLRLTGRGPDHDEPWGMQPWCVANFGTWTTLQAQAAFLLYEMERDYKALDEDLRAGTKSLATLTTDINRIFERSADNEAINQRRINYAIKLQNLLTKAPVPAPIPQTPPVIHTTAGGGAAIGAVILSWLLQFNVVPYLATIGLTVMATITGEYLWQKYHSSKTLPPVEPEPPEPIPVPVPAPQPTPADPVGGILGELAARAKAITDAQAAYVAEEAIAAKAVQDLQSSMAKLQAAIHMPGNGAG